jgi:hypothetical protein
MDEAAKFEFMPPELPSGRHRPEGSGWFDRACAETEQQGRNG